jgi:hypothetical protein
MRVIPCPNCDRDVEVEYQPTVRIDRSGHLKVDDQHVAVCLDDGWTAHGHMKDQIFIIDRQTGALAQEHDETS